VKKPLVTLCVAGLMSSAVAAWGSLRFIDKEALVRKLAVVAVVAVALAALGGAQALAQPGRTSTLISSCSTPLGPGLNKMTTSLTCSGGLVLTASNSTLDCQNYTLSAQNPSNLVGIKANSLQHIRIERCIVIGYKTNFYLNGITGSVIQANVSLNAGSVGSGGFLVQKSNADYLLGNAAWLGKGRGFLLSETANDRLQNDVADFNSFRGFDIENGTTKAQLSDDSAMGNSSAGFVIGPHNVAIWLKRSVAEDNQGYGIVVFEPANASQFLGNFTTGNTAKDCADYNGPTANHWIGNQPTGATSYGTATC